MIYSTRGIVLNHLRYAESSIIVHIYTEMFGQQSYIINGVRSVHNKGKSVFLQPLTLLELQVYHHPKKELHRIKDFKLHLPLLSVPFDQHKRSIAFFITEVMNHSFREEESNPELFNFVTRSIIELDQASNRYSHFHLFFLARLTSYLGFYPDLEKSSKQSYFDLQNGHLTDHEPNHPYFLSEEKLKVWIEIFSEKGKGSELSFKNTEIRQALLQSLIDYYALHLDGFGKIKSLEILQQLYK